MCNHRCCHAHYVTLVRLPPSSSTNNPHAVMVLSWLALLMPLVLLSSVCLGSLDDTLVTLYAGPNRNGAESTYPLNAAVEDFQGPLGSALIPLDTVNPPYSPLLLVYTDRHWTGNRTVVSGRTDVDFSHLGVRSLRVVAYNDSFATVNLIGTTSGSFELAVDSEVRDFNDTITYVEFSSSTTGLVLQLFPQPQLRGEPMEFFATPFWQHGDLTNIVVRSIAVVGYERTMGVVDMYTEVQRPPKRFHVGDIENDFQTNNTDASVHILRPDIALVVFPRPGRQGTPTYVVQNELWTQELAALTTARSFQILSRETLEASVRPTAKLAVVVWIQQWTNGKYLGNILTYELLGVGDTIANASFPMYIAKLDIPHGLQVQAFRQPNFEGPPIVWSTPQEAPFVLSLRVASQDTPPDVTTKSVVTFYPLVNGQRCEKAVLYVGAGDTVTSVLYLKALFFDGFEVMDVPTGLVLWGYPEPSLGGPPVKFTPQFYWHKTMTTELLTAMRQMQSFQVTTAEGGATPAIDPPLTVLCHRRNMAGNRFHIGGEYPMVQPGLCLSFDVPPGVALVLYDRHWHLGQSYVWNLTHNASVLTEWSSRVRSLQVVRRRDIAATVQTLPQATFEGTHTVQFSYSESESYDISVGASVPAIGVWERPQLVVYPPEGLVLVGYTEYNFQGRQNLYTTASPYKPYKSPPFKSYEIVRQVNSQLDTPILPPRTTTVALVGCYTLDFGFDTTPIYLAAGDRIPTLIFPWNNHIANCTVPLGLVVVAFGQPNFQGQCESWTTNASVRDYVMEVRSLQVWNTSLWTACPTQTTSSLPVTSTSRPSITTMMTTTTTTLSPRTTRPTQPPREDEVTDDVTPSDRPRSTIMVTANPTPSLTTSGLSATPQVSGDDGTNATSTNNSTQTRGDIVPIRSTTDPRINKTTPTAHNTTTNNQGPLHGNTQGPLPQNDQEPLPDSPPTTPRSTTPLRNRISTKSTAWLFVGCAGGIVLLVVMAMAVERSRLPNVAVAASVAIAAVDYSLVDWRDLDLLRLHSPPLALEVELVSGAGTFSRIYRTTLLDQAVVVKTLPTETPTPTQVQAFIDEIQFMGQLKSPFIVLLEGAAWTNPTDLQAVMEYMDMGDLRSHLASTTPSTFDWNAKLACAQSIAEGLFYLHSQNLIHRDVKSRNILLDSVKGTKLADFGSSKEVVYGDTMTAAVGTFRWMAPEMLLFQGYSNAVDIFSFGVVLSELDTHALPYADVVGDIDGRELSDEAMARRVIHEGLRPSLRKDCPDWYRKLALQCMDASPEERPSAFQLMVTLRGRTVRT
ncbi:Aste57867_8606 [Aphanomyces stellatus]|uniref:Aste57867_8606 protein n=1 Tax=Aphanomyces stellatus TaxID=120398 RepID=A0A485KKU6_9STRA|nr:hypothetical protein As57867_008572 [Aphanomyces stellatus]VFT85492.1 Aste57867_8606 [Aphanomyces stellatus]